MPKQKLRASPGLSWAGAFLQARHATFCRALRRAWPLALVYDFGMQWRQDMRDGIPGAVVALAGVGVWVAGRGSAAGPEQSFVGWLLLLLVASTVACISVVATGEGCSRRMITRLSFCLFVPCVLVAARGFGGGYMQAPAFLSVSLVFITWCFLWASVVGALRPLGTTPSAALALIGAMMCMASPIVLMPLVHATDGSAAVVQFIRHACPFFAVLDGLRPGINVDWSHLPAMYAWSGLGQDVPMLLPNAWLCAGIYGAVGAGVAIVRVGDRSLKGRAGGPGR